MPRTVFDPLRRIDVPLTPEERVRQWFIGILADVCAVPMQLMCSECAFKLSNKQYRADILLWDRNAKPLAVVECKRPDVKISAEVLDQAIRYNMALELRWIFLTNGDSTIVLHKTDGRFVPVKQLPSYEQMLSE